jgi:hypothetical protein
VQSRPSIVHADTPTFTPVTPNVKINVPRGEIAAPTEPGVKICWPLRDSWLTFGPGVTASPNPESMIATVQPAESAVPWLVIVTATVVLTPFNTWYEACRSAPLDVVTPALAAADPLGLGEALLPVPAVGEALFAPSGAGPSSLTPV